LKTPNCVAVIDDRAARRCSQSMGIITIGTGRVLILAKQREIISSVSSRIQTLREAGLWLSDNLVALLTTASRRIERFERQLRSI